MPSFLWALFCFVIPAVTRVHAISKGFMMVLPRQLQANTMEKACFSFHNYVGVDLKASIRFYAKRRNPMDGHERTQFYEQEEVFHDGVGRCLSLGIPSRPADVDPWSQIVVVVDVFEMQRIWDPEAGAYVTRKTTAESEVTINEKSLLTFIQTDKPIYKPGQTVKFRLISLTGELKPYEQILRRIWVEDAQTSRVAQWSNVTSTSGLVGLELPLSKEPNMGVWNIKALVQGIEESQSFRVMEYVLPKFEVKIEPPSYVLMNEETIRIKVCAKYTYGEPVRGRMSITVGIKNWGGLQRGRPTYSRIFKQFYDCKTISMPSSEIELDNSNYPLWGSRLHVFAEVLETATGIRLNSTHESLEISKIPLDLDLSEIPTYFKPYLPFRGKMRAKRPNGAPAALELLEVEVLLSGGQRYVGKGVTNFTTNANGEAWFSVPHESLDASVTSIEVIVKVKGYGAPGSRDARSSGKHHMSDFMHNRQLTIKRWFSPSGSYLKILPSEDVQPLDCDSNIIFNVLYTSKDKKLNKFHYQILSRGHILHNGIKQHFFSPSPLRSSDPRSDEYLEILATPTEPPTKPPTEPPTTSRPPHPPFPEMENGIDCRASLMGKHYRGNANTTRGGHTCQAWSIQQPNEHSRTPENYPNNGLTNNYCRNPDDEAGGPWCYTTGSKRWDYCDILFCPGSEVVIPHLDIAPPTVSPVPYLDPSNFVLQFRIDSRMSPVTKVIVHYIREDGEIIADSMEIKVNECFENKVSMSFRNPRENRLQVAERRPGDKVKLRLQAHRGSLCAYGVVDKSVHLMGGNNQLTTKKVFEELGRFDHGFSYYYPGEDEFCHKKREERKKREEEQEKESGSASGGNRPKRGRRDIDIWRRYWPVGSIDTLQAFKDTSLVVLTDLTLHTRPCHDIHRPMPIALASANRRDNAPGGPAGRAGLGGLGGRQSNLVVRSYFPETWLWNMEETGSDGVLEVDTKVPHTITEWVGQAFCTSPEKGLGVAEKTQLKAFQPFFVSYTLPYSAVRGEKLPLKVTVFNYLEASLVVRLRLKRSADFDLLDQAEREAFVCVGGSKAETHVYKILPRTLGQVNITVTAKTVDGHQDLCSAEDGRRSPAKKNIGIQDAVIRPLLVEPEGIAQEYSFSDLICPHLVESSKIWEQQLNLDIPATTQGYVNGSGRGEVTVVGDVMGAAMSNIDQLLGMPYGCGEQNMVKFAPNIFIMKYLKAIGREDPATTEQATLYMKTGYQRELSFQHPDGSYSAFGPGSGIGGPGHGPPPEPGSLWLTAFVIKCFAQAKPFIFISEDEIQKSVRFLMLHQREDGSFPVVGKLFSKSLKGGLANVKGKKGAEDVGLTAFTLVALMEAGLNRDAEIVDRGFAFLADIRPTSVDTYTAALVTYAFAILDPKSSKMAEWRQNLESRAVVGNSERFWKAKDEDEDDSEIGWNPPWRRSNSANVETTAYALLSLMAEAEAKQKPIINLNPIVNWLTKQRNAFGGFSSTQDTVLGIQALGVYAGAIYGGRVSLQVRFRETEGAQEVNQFRIRPHNALKLHRVALAKLPSVLQIQAMGQGCAVLQANIRYNVEGVAPTSPKFELSTRVIGNVGKCKKAALEICGRYLGDDGASNMAVVEVKMVTGWKPVKDSLQLLKTSKMISKFELDGKRVQLYFNEMLTLKTCFKMEVLQTVDVEDAKPSTVRLYDYYEPKQTASTTYEMNCAAFVAIPYFLGLPLAAEEEASGEAEIEEPEIVPLTAVTLGNGEELCENHDYNKTQCLAVGCCHWKWRRCFSAVGARLCREKSKVPVGSPPKPSVAPAKTKKASRGALGAATGSDGDNDEDWTDWWSNLWEAPNDDPQAGARQGSARFKRMERGRG